MQKYSQVWLPKTDIGKKVQMMHLYLVASLICKAFIFKTFMFNEFVK